MKASALLEECHDEALVAPGGVIANIGVHGVKVDLHLDTYDMFRDAGNTHALKVIIST